jgi:hypothetical protein
MPPRCFKVPSRFETNTHEMNSFTSNRDQAATSETLSDAREPKNCFIWHVSGKLPGMSMNAVQNLPPVLGIIDLHRTRIPGVSPSMSRLQLQVGHSTVFAELI